MKYHRIILVATFVAVSMAIHAQFFADYNIIPRPKVVNVKGGQQFCRMDGIKYIDTEGMAELQQEATLLREYVEEATGRQLSLAPVRNGGKVVLRLDKRITHPEGYELHIGQHDIIITGSTSAGVFYGIQALRKALPQAPAESIRLPQATVSDQPRFSYRGMHLDVCRHFFGMDFVKQYIDMLALHGMNTLHWHLTDDQGWRIEIKKYPRLTEVGAWRDGTVVGRNTGVYDHERHGGFFTQEEAREIVSYAADRHITVIPEIDMPGHMTAALAAYPQYGCTGGPYEVIREWGVFDEILCAGNDEVYTFVNDILDELTDIFPSTYIHLGGDEAPRKRWKECPKCQQRIAEAHLDGGDGTHGEDQLQGYFIRRIEKHLQAKGRKLIGWDELMECGVDSTATIMSWRGVEGGQTAAHKGHDVIMVPTSVLYFDYYQTPEDNWSKPLLIGGYNPIEKVYAFNPAPDNLPASVREHIIGVQANLWTEYIYCKELAEYQVLPRMAALSEIQWVQPSQKNYANFCHRLPSLLRLYDRNGWKYCHADFK